MTMDGDGTRAISSRVRPAVLVLAFSPLGRDPRVHRQLRLLRDDYRVTAAGFTDPRLSGVEFIPIRPRPRPRRDRPRAFWQLAGRRHARYYWTLGVVRDALAVLGGRAFDAIIANDAETWPLAHAIRGRAALIFDAHEFSPAQFADRPSWRMLRQPYRTWLCREFLPRADAVVTVCDTIADEYARVFGIPRPGVVLNAPARHPAEPRPTAPDRIRMVHHGFANPSRHLEVMIDVMRGLDARFTLDLMLVDGPSWYGRDLRRRAAGDARIRFRPPVPMPEIIPTIRAYDLGLSVLPPVNFNLRAALPNKFFEFVQARLAVAVGPSPEMARLVREHGFGIVADDFTAVTLARHLQALDVPTLDRHKAASHVAADQLCWETAGHVLQDRLEHVLKTSTRADR